MQKKVAVIHTSFVSVNDFKEIFQELMPEVAMTNIVDDSLLPEVIQNGGITSNVIRKISVYALEAQAMGADIILNQCSSVGEAADIARKLVKIPILKIDEPMAEAAVRIGGTVSVIATLPSTFGPSTRLVETAAREAGKEIKLRKCLIEGAFDALIKEGKEKHNSMVINRVLEEAKIADVIVLAQGSMYCLLPQLIDIKVPVLTSPRIGINRVKERLGL